jgi:radical SAM superfamily enzyme YgiQ (UPF0313 family)
MRIALIAMSGVRAHNPELTRLGMTLPGFVERSRVIASLPSLGLLTLAGMTPDRFDVSYHEVADLRTLGELPECDLAAISSFTAQVRDGYALAERYRQKGALTVMGGLHASARPAEALKHVDAVVIGEGELSWPELLRDAERGRLARVYDADGRQFDLAESPMPRFDLLQPEKYNRLTVQTQRGCPWHCEFCASSVMLSPRFKVKPVKRVVEEIRAIRRAWPRPFIEFADDNTFANKRHAKSLMRAVAPEGVRWFAETDVSVADDNELIALMRDAGCAQVLIGLESPTASSLDGLELRRNWKRSRAGQYIDAIEAIQSRGIAVIGCFILGLDGDSASVFDEVRRFAQKSGLAQVQITVQTPFPGTPLRARLQREGRLLHNSEWERYTLFDVNYLPKQMSVAELERGLIELGRALYSEGSTRQRRIAFHHMARGTVASTATGGWT